MLKKILPQLLTYVTGTRRQYVRVGSDFEWPTVSWTHTIFRSYELIFGRRYGIKAEMSSSCDEEGNVVYAAHSWEAAISLTERYVRDGLRSWKFEPIRIHIPMLQTTAGFPVPASPFLFAIAFDASSKQNNNPSTSQNTAHVVGGSNTFLFAGIFTNNDAVTAVKWDIPTANQSFTQLYKNNFQSSNYLYTYYLVGATAGSKNINVASSSNPVFSTFASYSGVDQGSIDSSHQDTGASGTTITGTTTVVAANSWLVAYFAEGALSTMVAGAGTTLRLANDDTGLAIMDSNGGVAAGSRSLIGTFTGSNVWVSQLLSIAPVAGTAYTSTLTETMVLVPALSNGAGKVATETFTLTDTIRRGITRTISEVISMTDVVAAGKFYFTTLTETITLTPSFIVNGTNVVWGHITRSAAAVWTKINRH